MKTFEYKVVHSLLNRECGDDRFPGMGREGWELVAVAPGDNPYHQTLRFIFKREVAPAELAKEPK